MVLTTDTERYPSEFVDTQVLAEEIVLPFSKISLPSRLVKSPMTEDIASWDQRHPSRSGVPSQELIRVYEEWGKGGYGMLITGNVVVSPSGLQAPGNGIICKEFESSERINAFSQMAKVAKRHGSLVVMQINHAGRQVPDYINPHPVSASDVGLGEKHGRSFGKPTPLTKEGIDEIVDQFGYAAEFAHRTGFDGVQLHCAHGYLLAQFLSSTTNLRTDEYGGSLENRARIISRIIEEIKRRVPPTFSVSIKINSVEFQRGGFQPEECRAVCAQLESLGLDFIELSGGTYEELAFHHKRGTTKEREAFFAEFADVIRPAVKASKIVVTGGFRTSDGMVRSIRTGSTDLIGIGRPACQEPDFARLLLSGKIASARKTLLPENDDVLQTLAAGTQIGQIGLGEEPFNQADPREAEGYMLALGVYMQTFQEKAKEGVILAGYPRMPRTSV